MDEMQCYDDSSGNGYPTAMQFHVTIAIFNAFFCSKYYKMIN